MVEYTTQYNLDHLFHSLADPTRRDMLLRVCHNKQTISDLAAHYDMSFAGVAKHLNVLAKADLVTKVKQGKEQIIEVNPHSFAAVSTHLQRYTRILQNRYNALEALLQEDI